jgi:hypothetical protein
MLNSKLKARLAALIDVRVQDDEQSIVTRTGVPIGYANDPALAELIVVALRRMQADVKIEDAALRRQSIRVAAHG